MIAKNASHLWMQKDPYKKINNDLVTSLAMHKFIDDTTLAEIIPKHNNSVMQSACSVMVK